MRLFSSPLFPYSISSRYQIPCASIVSCNTSRHTFTKINTTRKASTNLYRQVCLHFAHVLRHVLLSLGSNIAIPISKDGGRRRWLQLTGATSCLACERTHHGRSGVGTYSSIFTATCGLFTSCLFCARCPQGNLSMSPPLHTAPHRGGWQLCYVDVRGYWIGVGSSPVRKLFYASKQSMGAGWKGFGGL